MSVYAERFWHPQDRRCFYSGDRLSLTGPRAGEVDHFILWARYPLDSPFNLVLASKRENQRLRDALRPAAMRQRWLARNDAHLEPFVAPEPEGFGAEEGDPEAVRAVAGWVYGGG